MNAGVMFNAYPDSCGGSLSDVVDLLARREVVGTFSLMYVLPSMFRSDLDRGFSIISYDLDEAMATRDDLVRLDRLGIQLKLDFVLNHLSAQSPQFLDLLKRGDASPATRMFIDWNAFWEGRGEPGPEGYIVPHPQHLEKLFMRKPGLPILAIPFPDGSTRFYWNTFYQQVVTADEDQESPPHLQGRRYLVQMDLDARSPAVWEFYHETMGKLASYGARIVRLDAFAYLHKEVGRSNFFNTPGTWEYLERIQTIADDHEIELLPEIHATHREGLHRHLAERGYRFYDFFFPALVIHAIEHATAEKLVQWIGEIQEHAYRTVNMLGCHDGIPVLDVQGLLDDGEIQGLIDLIVERGGRLKDLYGPDGKRIAYYQVNATFYSALGEDDEKLLLARALQLFMPGIPQVWYLDLFAGTNDYAAADTGGHKEINRTNLSREEIARRLEMPVVKRQLELLRFRNSHPAFETGAHLDVETRTGGTDVNGRARRDGIDTRDAAVSGDAHAGRRSPTGSSGLSLTWTNGPHQARLQVDLADRRWDITAGTEGDLHPV